MTDNRDHIQKGADTKNPAIYISEPNTPVYVSKEAAFTHVKETLQKVEKVRSSGIEGIDEVMWDASEKAYNYYATLDHFKKAQKEHEIAEVVLYVGVASALTGLVAYSGLSLFQWFYKRIKSSGKKKFNNRGNGVELGREGTDDLQGDNFKIRSRRSHSRDWHE